MKAKKSMDLASWFRDHSAERRARLAEALSSTGFEALVISSGAPYTYFADDQPAPFHTAGHFAHWCPAEGPHHLLHLEPGRTPRLLRYAPEDFWYETKPRGEVFWTSEFDSLEAGTVDAVWEALGKPKHGAYIGNETARAEAAGLAVSPEKLIAHLDWDRAYKTDYELHCLDEASALGAKGHQAAKEAFDSGASELEVHYAFVRALGVTDTELPYPSIVAFDEKGAFLHYENKRTLREGKVMLIDAGGQVRGYASDITRTHTAQGCDARFVSLRDEMEKIQQGLCQLVRPGVAFGFLHDEAHRKIAVLLEEADLLDAGPEEAVAKGWSRPFFPHGLGHHLGLQVHDVGGRLKDREGNPAPPPENYPHLRNTRTLEPRHVFTVEPGLYFIEMLLRPFREGEDRRRFNWKLIDELSSHGGIRIEDDVVVTADGHRNLTRQHLPS
jgi:Xaa-Pro dipeptidase